MPVAGTEADKLIRSWREKDKIPALPLDYRLDRMMRVVVTTPRSIQDSLEQFDKVVARIEICRGKELQHGFIIQTWEKNSSDESTCTACDARTFCPSYGKEVSPSLPAVRTKP